VTVKVIVQKNHGNFVGLYFNSSVFLFTFMVISFFISDSNQQNNPNF
jgi:hypothetical protein